VSAISVVGFMTIPAVYIMIVFSQSPVIVLDFDGTVTEKDIGDEVCDRFAPPEWRELDAAWVRHEISLPEAQRRMWALARAQRAEAVAYALTVGQIRRGLDRMLEAAARRGDELWLASGGFDFYIEAILGARLGQFTRRFYNRTDFVDGRIVVEFPHEGIACARCAVCKGKVCDDARATGRPVVFIGDGSSDRCAIGRADRIFAVRGSLLARTCAERGVEHIAFDGFDEITERLSS
jgi:2,3-diketo-5-methylthio-1-phosphopentane phosphatase